MKEIIQFTEFTLEIWRRPRQRNMHLTVQGEGTLRVTCNRRVSKRQILGFVQESQAFIARRQSEIRALNMRFPPKVLLSGEPWLFLGQRLELQMIWSWGERIHTMAQADAILEMKAPIHSTPQARRQAMYLFYRQQARAHFANRLREWSEHMNLRPSGWSLRGQTTRWGSCTSQGQISLNWKLMAAPAAVIDYVIVHELAHLEHLNHSPQFWRLVERFLPNWREAKQWLKINEAEIRYQFRG